MELMEPVELMGLVEPMELNDLFRAGSRVARRDQSRANSASAAASAANSSSGAFATRCLRL